MAHQTALGELLEHAGPMAHGPPAFEVGLQGRVGRRAGQAVQQAAPGPGSPLVVLADGEAHCPALPDI